MVSLIDRVFYFVLLSLIHIIICKSNVDKDQYKILVTRTEGKPKYDP